MEQIPEVCVNLEYCLILNANEDAGGRLDTAGENQGAKTKSCVVMSPDGVDHPLKANEVENMDSTSVMVLIDGKLEGAASAAGDFIIGGGGKEKRKKAASSAKKPPKPPQSHRGDATDHQKLIIKELAELAIIKRARIERMKALMEKKAAAANLKNSPSSSSGGNLFAMLFTILVFFVLLFQGMSCHISCGTFRGSPPTTQANETSLIFIQEELNPSAHDSV